MSTNHPPSPKPRAPSHGELLLENIALLAGGPTAFEARYGHRITPTTFRPPGPPPDIAHAVLHFLLVVIGAPDAPASFAHCYPVLDRAQERDFRKLVEARLLTLERLKLIPHGLARKSSLQSFAGDKFEALLSALSTAALKELAQRHPAYTLTHALVAPLRNLTVHNNDHHNNNSLAASQSYAKHLRLRIAAERALFAAATRAGSGGPSSNDHWLAEAHALKTRIHTLRTQADHLRSLVAHLSMTPSASSPIAATAVKKTNASSTSETCSGGIITNHAPPTSPTTQVGVYPTTSSISLARPNHHHTSLSSDGNPLGMQPSASVESAISDKDTFEDTRNDPHHHKDDTADFASTSLNLSNPIDHQEILHEAAVHATPSSLANLLKDKETAPIREYPNSQPVYATAPAPQQHPLDILQVIALATHELRTATAALEGSIPISSFSSQSSSIHTIPGLESKTTKSSESDSAQTVSAANNMSSDKFLPSTRTATANSYCITAATDSNIIHPSHGPSCNSPHDGNCINGRSESIGATLNGTSKVNGNLDKLNSSCGALSRADLVVSKAPCADFEFDVDVDVHLDADVDEGSEEDVIDEAHPMGPVNPEDEIEPEFSASSNLSSTAAHSEAHGALSPTQSSQAALESSKERVSPGAHPKNLAHQNLTGTPGPVIPPGAVEDQVLVPVWEVAPVPVTRSTRTSMEHATCCKFNETGQQKNSGSNHSAEASLSADDVGDASDFHSRIAFFNSADAVCGAHNTQTTKGETISKIARPCDTSLAASSSVCSVVKASHRTVIPETGDTVVHLQTTHAKSMPGQESVAVVDQTFGQVNNPAVERQELGKGKASLPVRPLSSSLPLREKRWLPKTVRFAPLPSATGEKRHHDETVMKEVGEGAALKRGAVEIPLQNDAALSVTDNMSGEEIADVPFTVAGVNVVEVEEVVATGDDLGSAHVMAYVGNVRSPRYLSASSSGLNSKNDDAVANQVDRSVKDWRLPRRNTPRRLARLLVPRSLSPAETANIDVSSTNDVEDMHDFPPASALGNPVDHSLDADLRLVSENGVSSDENDVCSPRTPRDSLAGIAQRDDLDSERAAKDLSGCLPMVNVLSSSGRISASGRGASSDLPSMNPRRASAPLDSYHVASVVEAEAGSNSVERPRYISGVKKRFFETAESEPSKGPEATRLVSSSSLGAIRPSSPRPSRSKSDLMKDSRVVLFSSSFNRSSNKTSMVLLSSGDGDEERAFGGGEEENRRSKSDFSANSSVGGICHSSPLSVDTTDRSLPDHDQRSDNPDRSSGGLTSKKGLSKESSQRPSGRSRIQMLKDRFWRHS